MNGAKLKTEQTADMHAAHGRLRVEPVATPYPLRKLLAGITLKLQGVRFERSDTGAGTKSLYHRFQNSETESSPSEFRQNLQTLQYQHVGMKRFVSDQIYKFFSHLSLCGVPLFVVGKG